MDLDELAHFSFVLVTFVVVGTVYRTYTPFVIVMCQYVQISLCKIDLDKMTHSCFVLGTLAVVDKQIQIHTYCYRLPKMLCASMSKSKL